MQTVQIVMGHLLLMGGLLLTRAVCCVLCSCQGLVTGQRERITMRPQAMLEAKDLPHNDLSRLLEQRVNQKLEEDRQMRAQQLVSACVSVQQWHC